MAISMSASTLLPLLLVGLVLYATPAAAFGAGNIASFSKVEGVNWRHGDIEDTLLSLFMAAAAAGGKSKRFDTMSIKRVYFGNWLRDYSQAIDVGALKFVKPGTVRIILWILSFMTFGLATGEFEVTEERLGCYRPEEHIDNPKDYADNEDATEYYPGLRKPVEQIELDIDEQTGMKNYIANERIRLDNGDRMDSSAGLIRKLFTKCIRLARRYRDSGNEEDLFEAFRLLGTGLHCIEDFSAHSNYTELALIELGETSVFPHVGSATMMNVQGKDIWPLVTGTFGGVDFLHSVLGEAQDKMIQSELQQLETNIEQAKAKAEEDGDETSIVKTLLSKFLSDSGSSDEDLPNEADRLKEKSDRSEPWGSDTPVEDMVRDLYPYLEFHDKVMKAINNAMEKMGIAAVAEKLAEAMSLFIFTLIAPYILPLLEEVKGNLADGSNGVIQSSQAAQHIVFEDDESHDPTHSMLSKDHFTNVLNEPAGKIASAILKFAVPRIMEAWDNDDINPDEVCDEIIGGVFHHPAFRDGSDGRPGLECREKMFAVVENWWNELDSGRQDQLREALTREGVREGKNHEGNDTGHGGGCNHPLKRNKFFQLASGERTATELIAENAGSKVGERIEEAIGGGVGGSTGAGSFLGGLLGAAVGKAFSRQEPEAEEDTYQPRETESTYRPRQTELAYGREAPGGYPTREEGEGYGGGYQRTEESSYERPSYGEESYNRGGEYGGYERREESSYERREESSYEGGYERRQEGHGGGYGGGYEQRQEGYGGGYGGGYEQRQEGYGGGEEGGYGRREGGYGGEGEYGRREGGYGEQGGYGDRSYGEGDRGYGGRRDGKTSHQHEEGSDIHGDTTGYPMAGKDKSKKHKEKSKDKDDDDNTRQNTVRTRSPHHRKHDSGSERGGSGDEKKYRKNRRGSRSRSRSRSRRRGSGSEAEGSGSEGEKRYKKKQGKKKRGSDHGSEDGSGSE